jgi:starvation-inducible DNA-binding protein
MQTTTEKAMALGRAAAIVPEERLEAAGILQRLLTDIIDLTLQAKQAHWNLRGPHFRGIHLQLDDLVATGRDYSDRLAERCLALGAAADGRAASVASGTSLEPFPEGRIEDRQVLQYIADRLRTISEVGHSRLERLDEVDPVSQSLVCELLEQIEKQLWMFESSRV